MSQLLVIRAAHFAARKHSGQRRKDQSASPYINHPLFVTLLLGEVGQVGDPVILAAALLHDTLEDTDTTAAELDREFGAQVRALVEEVTDDKTLPKTERKRRQIEHAASLSHGAVLIKLGDKIANVVDVTHAPPPDWSRERRSEYLDWAEAVIGACPSVNVELESYFFRVLREGRALLNGS